MIKSPAYYRLRLAWIPKRLMEWKGLYDWKEKNSPYGLLLSYGVAPESHSWPEPYPTDPAEPLTFTEWCTWNTWFEAHPEKVCGREVITSSREFPISIEGTKDDIIRAIRATTAPADRQPAATGSSAKIKLMKLKAKAILILQQQERERAGIGGLGFLGTLSGRGLGTLGKLADDTSKVIADNEAQINALLDQQDRSRKYKKGDILSFKDIVANYNPGLTDEEIRAWVWYKRSIGVPMTGWEAYFLKAQKAKAELPEAYTRPHNEGGRSVIIRDNHFREIGKVGPAKPIGRATSKKLQYDKTTTYLIVRMYADVLSDVPANSLVYVNEADVIVDKPADNVDDAILKSLVERGLLFYSNGRLMPYPVYAYGNMYDRELQLTADTETILSKYGEKVLLTHRHVIQAAKPRLISVQNADPRERPKILAISEFASDFDVFDLREDAGVDLQQIAKQKVGGFNAWRNNQAQRDEMADFVERQAPDGRYSYSLVAAFQVWMATLPKGDFREVSAAQISYYYIEGRALGKSLSEEEKDTISKYTALEGEELFSRFLNEALSFEDQQKLDFSWNRVYNAWSSIPYHRVPVGFSCSAYFKRSLLQFTPAQREAIAFMEIAGSGCLAYDVGVGKTMSAIITLANSLTSGKCKRPIIAVPNPTYAKWLREIVGYEDKASGEFVPGVLSFTGVTINDWSNLGVDAVKKIKLDKPVPENSITVVTFEGLMKIGYGRMVMENLFDELAKILSQERHADKSNRDVAKLQQKWREMVGLGNKGTIADVDALGFDYLVIDEAHNFKNIFDQVPTDEDGKKRFKINGAQSDRGVKAFFLANYIQRTFGQNVMLLTATPFTNSPLEIYSMLSLVGYNSLKAMGITSLETFCETFVLQSLEYVNNYKGEIVLDNVVKSYNNRLVLQRLIHNHIAYKTGEEAGVKRPVKINLPRLTAQQADGSFRKLPLPDQIVTYLRPNQAQQANQSEIEELANQGGMKALANIGKALGQNLDNALSPYLYINNADKQPTCEEYVEGSPKIHYACECIASVKAWHEERGEPVSGQVIYMNRGKDFFPLVKEYLEKVVGYKKTVRHNGRAFDEIEFITSEVSGERKEAIKDAFLAGVVKIIIGTATIKEGIDLQTKGTVLYNLYPDWNPTDIKQLEGRIYRQGNEFGYVRSVMPLVQDTMDVFVFQKLEEKTSRINDIWYRADRGNVLDQESLDPMEIKFALFSDVDELMRVKIDQIKKEINRKLAVTNANIDALLKFTSALSSYRNYQIRIRAYIKKELGTVADVLSNWTYYNQQDFYVYPLVRAMDAKKREQLRESLQEWLTEAQSFDSSVEQADKEMIRVFDRVCTLWERTMGRAGWSYYNYISDLSEFKQRLSEVRKTERTILTTRGLTINDDLTALMGEYNSEKAALELEGSQVNSVEYKMGVRDEIKASKEKNAITGAIAPQRAEDFAKLNYLLAYKAADVPAYAFGLPNQTQPRSQARTEAPQPDAVSDAKAKKIKVLKLKAKAILILQEQELEQAESYRQAA